MPDTNTITKIALPSGDVFNIVDKTSGYLTNYTETDPVFSASAAAGITATDISNWNSKTSNTGTVTQVSTGTGLSGGPITTSGTISLSTAKTSKTSSGLGGVQVWKNWESNSTITAPSSIGSFSGTVTVQNESTVSDRYYAVEATHDGHLIVNVPWTNINNSYLTSETDPTVPSWAKASTKPTYSLTEITGTDDLRVIEGLTGTSGLLRKTAANTWSLDTNTYLTSYTETDPTVPSWAKASTKPSYGLTEISGTDDLRAIEGLTGTSGFLKKTAANTWTLDTNTYLTSYTETDPTVPAWAKASSKPTYTASEVGASPTGHTHATTLSAGASGDTSTITLESAGKYKLTAGGTSAVFTMPTIPTVNYPVTSVNTKTGAVTLTASDVGASATGHTHATSIAASTGTSQIDLAANSKYQLSAGGTTYIFKTPANPDYSNTYAPKGHTHAVSITPSTTSVYSITGVGTANVPTKIDTTKFNGGSFTRGTFNGGSGSFTQGTFSGGSGSFTQGAFSGGSLTMSINGTDSKQLDITFTAATHGADSHTHVAATHGADSHTHTAATHAADSFTAASLGTGFYTAGTASTVPTRSQVSNLWNGYTAASAS